MTRPPASRSPRATAAIGKRNYSPQLELLRAGETVALDMAALTMHGTYFGPCRALGLLGDANDGSHPVQVLPVGRALHQARSVAVRGAQLVERVFTGGVLIAEILADFAVPSV